MGGRLLPFGNELDVDHLVTERASDLGVVILQGGSAAIHSPSRTRLDAVDAQTNAQSESIKPETERIEGLVSGLNERIAAANVAGSGGPSAEEVQNAQHERTAVNASILAYNSAVAANETARARGLIR